VLVQYVRISFAYLFARSILVDEVKWSEVSNNMVIELYATVNFTCLHRIVRLVAIETMAFVIFRSSCF
jgi:hypothetical protein